MPGVNARMSEPIEPSPEPKAKTPVTDFVQKTAEEVRRQPVKSLVWAFFVGIFLTIFPVGRIFRIVTSIIFGLLRPVLLVLGLVKVSEVLGEKCAAIRGGKRK
jgi:hypothetical protein